MELRDEVVKIDSLEKGYNGIEREDDDFIPVAKIPVWSGPGSYRA